MPGALATELQVDARDLFIELGEYITYRTQTMQPFSALVGAQTEVEAETSVPAVVEVLTTAFGDETIMQTGTIHVSPIDVPSPQQTDEYVVDGNTYAVTENKHTGATIAVEVKFKGVKR